MEYFSSFPVTEHITRIINPAGVYSYLVEGSSRAVLIDTGCGLGDLKAYVETLTKKPYVVLLTHGHSDHAGGASLFPEVYLNPLDWELTLSGTSIERRKRFLNLYTEVKDEDMAAPKSEGYLPIEDEQVWDLGEYHVRACSFPGHTAGSMAFLMEEEGVMLTGDCCNSYTFLQMPDSPVLSEYAKTVQSFAAKYGAKIRRILFSHGDDIGTPEIFSEAIELCRGLCDGTLPEIPAKGPMVEGFLVGSEVDSRNLRIDGKVFNCIYPKGNAR